LGSFQATIGAQPLPPFRTSKVQALLIYLAVEAAGDPAVSHRREALMELLWPGLPLKSAQDNLRQTLYLLRKAMPKQPAGDGCETLQLIASTRLAVGLNPEYQYELDVAAFTQYLQDNCLEEAVALYRGDFLADFYLADSSEFEGWAQVRRSELRRQALDALDTLATSYLKQGHFDQAQGYAQQQLAIDDLRERAYRQSMEALARSGQRSAALGQYETCRRRLADELGVVPSQETEALFRQVEADEIRAETVVEQPPVSQAKVPLSALPDITTQDLPDGTVTFLFTDIEGSTKLLHRLGDKYLSLLADHHRILREIFAKWNGREVNTRGDAFFVSFPRATEAVAAAVQAQRALARQTWPEGAMVKVRMGLHTGEPWTDAVDYVGMDVHRAARIAQVGHGGQVLLSETTAALVRSILPAGVQLLDLGLHRLKDMQFHEHIRQLVISSLPSEFPPLKSLKVVEPLEKPRFVPAPLPSFFKEQQADTVAPLFVGRERELAALMEILESVCGGEGQVRFVTGGAGRGKTALVAEFARQAQEADPELLAVSGHCQGRAGFGDPYLPFRRALAQLTGDVVARSGGALLTQEQARRLWAAMPVTAPALVTQAPDLVDSFVPGVELRHRAATFAAQDADWFRQLCNMLDEAGRENLQQERLFGQFTAALKTIASERPLLLIVEDLHWADAASTSLLFYLSWEIVDSPILLLGTYRPEEIGPGWGGEKHPLATIASELKRRHGDIWLDLGEMAAAEGRSFVDAYLDTEPNRLDEGFRGALFDQTGGHALFTVELLRAMQERGDLLQDSDGCWQASEKIDWATLPAKVEGVIEQRFGYLDEELKAALTVASVEGETFTAEVVAQVHKQEESDLVRQLSGEVEKRHRLVQAEGLAWVGSQRLARYRFRHQLFQQYLYQGLAAAERAYLHEAMGRTLEDLYGEEAEQAAALAWHFDQAGQGEKALPYLLQAGDRARILYATEEAARHYQRALAILKEKNDYERAARILMRLGLTYHSAFNYERSRQAYEESFALQKQSSLRLSSAHLAPAPHALRLTVREALTLDPGRHGDANTHKIQGQLFSALIDLTPDMNVVPDVAMSWEVLDDGQTYLFHLRDDVRWSDGEPVTAHDFVLGWRRALNPVNGSPAASNLYDVRGAAAFHQGEVSNVDDLGIKALDDWTLKIDLEQPSSYFLYLLDHCMAYPVPGHIVDSHGDAWTDLDHFVSNGPFHLESYKAGHLMVLRRNPTYHGHFRGNLEVIQLHIEANLVDDLDKLVPGYEKDEYDILDPYSWPPAERQRAIQRHATDYVTCPELGTWYVSFDVSRPPFDDPRVRRAFVLATDRLTLAAVDEMGHLAPATGGFIPPGMPGHVPGIALPYDLEQARRLLVDAGYHDGEGFPKVSAYTVKRGESFFEPVLNSWYSGLGVEFSLESLEWIEFLKRIRVESDLPHIYSLAWHADYPDPDSMMRLGKETASNWGDETYNALVEQARRVMDHDERMHLYRQAEEILVREAPFFPLYYDRLHLLVKPWIRNYRPNAINAPAWKDVIIEPH
jgi:ABC-type oligopeptide transport system substrate-binding subunit/DNA-binding SARP family transcriptional activator